MTRARLGPLLRSGPSEASPCLRDSDGHKNTPAWRQAQARNRKRRQRLVEHLHRLGPQPLFYVIREVEAGANVDATLLAYSEIDPDFVRALGGDRFPPAFHVSDGGRT